MVDIANLGASAQSQRTRLGRQLDNLAQALAGVGSFLARIYYKVVYALAAPFARLAARLEATEQKILDRGRSRGIMWRLAYWLRRLPVRVPRWALQKIAILIVDGPVWLAGAAERSVIDNVAYRRCWWRHGYRHCRYVRGYYGNYAYAPYYDSYYGYGYGPSLGLYFDGGGRGWGGGRGHFGGGHRR